MSDKAEIKCPNCGSDDVLKKKLSVQAFAISMLLLGFPIPFTSRKYHCFNCGADFKRKQQTGEGDESLTKETSPEAAQ